MILLEGSPLRPGAAPGAGDEIGHRRCHIHDPFFEPGAPILQRVAVGGGGGPFGGRGDARSAGIAASGHLDPRLERDAAEITLAHQRGDLVPPELQPGRVGGGWRAAAAVLRAEARHGQRMVTPGIAFIADMVPVQPIHVVAGHNVHRDVEEVLLHLRMAGVEFVVGAVPGLAGVVLRHPIGMKPVGVISLGRQRVFHIPEGIRDHPGMHLDAGAPVGIVGLVDQVLQRIKGGGDIRGFGFIVRLVVGIPAFAHLNNDGIAISRARIGHQLGHLGRRFESIVECVGPEGAKLGVGLGGDDGGQKKGGQKHAAQFSAPGNPARTRPVIVVRKDPH